MYIRLDPPPTPGGPPLVNLVPRPSTTPSVGVGPRSPTKRGRSLYSRMDTTGLRGSPFVGSRLPYFPKTWGLTHRNRRTSLFPLLSLQRPFSTVNPVRNFLLFLIL